eukprot:TRINITY_DN94_c0_g1_i2.p1 TRINITY_DN94_c0_g1~~TRINITY_DN94_c0_g1_i2.p1  ORF type:complete len:117 (+),score=34.08 TRINITY_DN94_c0_g1_i2:39-389(+)
MHEEVVRSKLQLKGSTLKDVSKKRRKKKKVGKEKVDLKNMVVAAGDEAVKIEDEVLKHEYKETEAEKRYREKKAQTDRINIEKQAQISHKERVTQFNEHLSKLSEHHDIPKISWTK